MAAKKKAAKKTANKATKKRPLREAKVVAVEVPRSRRTASQILAKPPKLNTKAGRTATVTVALKDLDKVCRECGKVKPDTRERTFYTKDFVGPCGDSFCYGSCDSPTCRAVTKVCCDACFKKLAHPARKY